MPGRGRKTNLGGKGRVIMFDKIKDRFIGTLEVAEAHCDGPCGVYDPAQARIEAESVLAMTKKILDLKVPEGDDAKAHAAYHNTLTRFIAVSYTHLRTHKTPEH